MMRVLSLFSGIGAHDYGLQLAGMKIVGQCEIDPFACMVLEKHWPGLTRWNDVRQMRPDDVVERCGRIDLVTGGFPCQDISYAGKGAGLDGAKSGLWFEMLRLIAGIRPRWIIAENVPALRCRGADRVFADLEEAGYAVWPCVVGAWAWGAPHKRDRVWIVGRRMDDAAGPGCETCKQPVAVEREPGLAIGRGSETGDMDDAKHLGRSEGCRIACDKKGERVGRRESVDAGARLADTEHGRRREQEPWRCEDRGTAAGGTGEGSGELVNAEIIGCGTRRAEHAERDDDTATGASASVADASGTGLEERRGRAIGTGPEVAMPASGGCHCIRWPARPGQPQHGWEEPRLVMWDVGFIPSRIAEWLDGRFLRGCYEPAKPSEVMRVLRERVPSQARFGQWMGGPMGEQEVLQRPMLSKEQAQVQPGNEGKDLRRGGPFGSDQVELRELRSNGESGPPPQGSQPSQQRPGQCNDAVRQLPHEAALEGRQATSVQAQVMRSLWKSSEQKRLLPETLAAAGEIWRSLTDEEKLWASEVVIGPCLIRRLRRWNRDTLKAAGNANPPWTMYHIGRWIMSQQPARHDCRACPSQCSRGENRAGNEE